MFFYLSQSNTLFKHYKVIVILYILILNSNHSSAQENVDSIYGHNPILYNGQLYSFSTHANTKGNQFLIDENYSFGSVQLGDQCFDNVLLNYDIYNQDILLKFIINTRTTIIKLSKEKVNSFVFGNDRFETIINQDSVNTIYKVYGDSKYKILFYYKKVLNLSTTSGTGTYEFSKPFKYMYIQYNGNIIRFKNNRSFLSKVNPEDKAKIKSFMKQNKINIKKATEVKLNDLIHFCNDL